MVRKPLERAAAARPREEAQLARANDLERLVADLELALARGVVPARAEAEVRPALADEVGDAPVAGAVEHAAVAQVATARDHEQRAGRLPGLLQQGGLRERNDGVGGGEEVAEGEEGVAD
ncbi:hypothetical protein N0V92_002781 [Colletotrichum tropicale]|nr:hypothetical protein N0V92_002781 [Colletotrichum tropicale]